MTAVELTPKKKIGRPKKAPELKTGANAPQVQDVLLRFERAGICEWNNARVSALCNSLNYTIWTLCVVAGACRIVQDEKRDLYRLVLDENLVRRSWENNHWPPILAVQFDRLEKYAKTRNGEHGAVLLGVGDVAAVKTLSAKG